MIDLEPLRTSRVELIARSRTARRHVSHNRTSVMWPLMLLKYTKLRVKFRIKYLLSSPSGPLESDLAPRVGGSHNFSLLSSKSTHQVGIGGSFNRTNVRNLSYRTRTNLKPTYEGCNSMYETWHPPLELPGTFPAYQFPSIATCPRNPWAIVDGSTESKDTRKGTANFIAKNISGRKPRE